MVKLKIKHLLIGSLIGALVGSLTGAIVFMIFDGQILRNENVYQNPNLITQDYPQGVSPSGIHYESFRKHNERQMFNESQKYSLKVTVSDSNNTEVVGRVRGKYEQQAHSWAFRGNISGSLYSSFNTHQYYNNPALYTKRISYASEHLKSVTGFTSKATQEDDSSVYRLESQFNQSFYSNPGVANQNSIYNPYELFNHLKVPVSLFVPSKINPQTNTIHYRLGKGIQSHPNATVEGYMVTTQTGFLKKLVYKRSVGNQTTTVKYHAEKTNVSVVKPWWVRHS